MAERAGAAEISVVGCIVANCQLSLTNHRGKSACRLYRADDCSAIVANSFGLADRPKIPHPAVSYWQEFLTLLEDTDG